MKKQQNLNTKKTFNEKYIKPISFIWDYMKTYKFLFIFVVVCSILISLIVSGVSVGQYYFLKYIQKAFNNGKSSQENTNALLFFVFLIISVIIAGILYIIQTTLMTKIAQYTSKIIRKDLYFKLLELRLKYFDTTPSGDIMSRLTNDINNITMSLTQNITQFLICSTQIIFFLIVLILFAPILGLISFLFVPIQLSVVYFFFKKAQPNFYKKQVLLGEINAFAEETISGQKIINNFNKQNLFVNKFKEKNEVLRVVNYKADFLSFISGSWNTLMANLLIAFLFILSMIFTKNDFDFGWISGIKENGKINPALVISLLTGVMSFSKNFSNPIYQIFQLLNVLQSAIAGSNRVMIIKEEKNEILPEIEQVNIEKIKGEIKFKNLSFSYDGKKDVLKNINLNVKPGQVVGIVGPTGSGKTTIINLLTKFYDVTNKDSDILIDGVSIKKITKESLRNKVSIVLQDTFVFANSIYENLRYANPNATNEEIIEAAKKANAHSFIMALEHGYDTILENNAEEISQGQRQQLAIARAFLKESSILILDEATSSIDTKTEKDIQTSMIELSKGKTTFMIAHRLSTIKHADIIVVLKDGEILEKGNHHELLKQNGFYANMYNSKLNTPEDI